jgi:uncharacterized protein (DUF2235 family)
MRRLAVFFDGTWNKRDDEPWDGDDNTNVVRLHDAVPARDARGVEQLKRYVAGVGTKWYERVGGGVAGLGLSENIREGYRFLVRNYRDGDEIFVFGFSRGAYSARSLVGMIRFAGLLKPDREKLVPAAYLLYRRRDDGPESRIARYFRRRHARDVRIKCLGVWDTVGALGIPGHVLDAVDREIYAFHDTELSGIVENAFHALAIDEHREDYAATLWDPVEKPDQAIEQAWFPGAHTDVGGGAGGLLCDVPLVWMARKAKACGLEIDQR